MSFKKLVSSALLAIVFILLGVWQLNRAFDLQNGKKVVADLPAVKIESLDKPGTNLPSLSVNRLVTLDGSYVKEFSAPNQLEKVNGKISTQTLEVRLMKLDSGSEILVVRGPSQMDAQKIDGSLQVFGRLYPRQSSDVAETSLNTLSRLDPALVLSSSATQVLDGYVIATSETNSFGQAIDFPRVAADRAVSPVAGFYWQHLTYVGIWWLFAVLVLIAPFYDRIRDRKMRVG